MVGGITVTGNLWSFAFHVMLFYLIAAITSVLLIAILTKVWLRPERPPTYHKPLKLVPPRIVRIE